MIQDIVRRFCKTKNQKKEKPKVLSLTSVTGKERLALQTPPLTRDNKDLGSHESQQVNSDSASPPIDSFNGDLGHPT